MTAIAIRRENNDGKVVLSDKVNPKLEEVRALALKVLDYIDLVKNAHRREVISVCADALTFLHDRCNPLLTMDSQGYYTHSKSVSKKTEQLLSCTKVLNYEIAARKVSHRVWGEDACTVLSLLKDLPRLPDRNEI